jgi:hypothetical protein
VPRTPTFPLFDQILNGRLESILRRYRAEGLGSPTITLRLAADHGVTVSERTVARWIEDIPKGVAA